MKKLNLLSSFILTSLLLVAPGCSDQSFEITESRIEIDNDGEPELLPEIDLIDIYTVYLIEYDAGTKEVRKQEIRRLFKKHPRITLIFHTYCSKDKELWYIDLQDRCEKHTNCFHKEDSDPKAEIEGTDEVSRVWISNSCK